jgi:hypothetical protein
LGISDIGKFVTQEDGKLSNFDGFFHYGSDFCYKKSNPPGKIAEGLELAPNCPRIAIRVFCPRPDNTPKRDVLGVYIKNRPCKHFFKKFLLRLKNCGVQNHKL